MWNNGLLKTEISEKLHVHVATVSRYLKIASKLKWCDWHSGMGHKIVGQHRSGKNHPFSKRVVRLSDGKVYDTIGYAANENNMARSTMDRRLKTQNGFMYYDEYFAIGYGK